MAMTGGSWSPDYNWNPLPAVTVKENQLSALRTAIGAGTYLNFEQAWHMAASMPSSAITNDLGDLYYCQWHWINH